MRRDTVGGTILVAAVLCVVCSIIVSSAAVLLRPLQEENALLDKQRNVLAKRMSTTRSSTSPVNIATPRRTVKSSIANIFFARKLQKLERGRLLSFPAAVERY